METGVGKKNEEWGFVDDLLVITAAMWLLAGVLALPVLIAHAEFPPFTTRVSTWVGLGAAGGLIAGTWRYFRFRNLREFAYGFLGVVVSMLAAGSWFYLH